MAFIDFLRAANPFRSRAATPPRGSWRTPLEMTTAPQAESLVKPVEGLEDAYFPKETPQDAIDAFLHFGEWLPVQSSNVEAIQYNGENSELYIRFLNGGLYQYQDVSIREAESFAKASSKGGWVWDRLRVRHTVFGFRKPYEYLSGVSTYTPKWMRKPATRALHGSIGPSGDVSRKTLDMLMPRKWMK